MTTWETNTERKWVLWILEGVWERNSSPNSFWFFWNGRLKKKIKTQNLEALQSRARHSRTKKQIKKKSNKNHAVQKQPHAPSTRTERLCWSSGAAADWPPLMSISWSGPAELIRTSRSPAPNDRMMLSPSTHFIGIQRQFSHSITNNMNLLRVSEITPQTLLKVVCFQRTFLFLAHFRPSSAPQLIGAVLIGERTFCWLHMHWFAF